MLNKSFAIVLSVVIIAARTAASSISGNFQVRLKSFDSASGIKNGDMWRICLTNYQSNPVDDIQCKFSKEVHVDSSVLQSGVELPFSFVWPGSFSLFIQSWSGPVPISPIFSNLLVFDTGFATLDAKASDNWSAVKLNDKKLNSRIVIEYRIACSKGFFGDYCERICTARGDNVICSSNGTVICAPGWKGSKCDQAVCKRCEVNGRCVKPDICQCDLGWTGPNCDQCVIKPNCVHGTCQKPNECNCDRGWGGQFCDIDLEYCTRHKPCKNGASCQNGGAGNYTSYTCTCLPGFTGRQCEIKLNGCPVKTIGRILIKKGIEACQNGGLCLQNSMLEYSCNCLPGYTGKYCENRAIWCENQCHNGGKCVFNENMLNYTCECIAGFSGTLCEGRESVCEFQNLCMNGGTCEVMSNGFLCKCPAGFWGHFCEFPLNPCETAVCENGGKCISMSDGHYECRCAPGFQGRNCDIKDVGCDASPCGNGSTCITTPFGHRCLCGPCYKGPDCHAVDGQCLIKIAHTWNSTNESFLILIAVLTFLILVILVILLCWKCHLRRSTVIDPVTENMINAHRNRLYQLPSIDSKINRNTCEASALKYTPVPVSHLKTYTKSNVYSQHQPGSSTKSDKPNIAVLRSQPEDEIYAEVDECELNSNFPPMVDKFLSKFSSELKDSNRYNCDRMTSQFNHHFDIHTNV